LEATPPQASLREKAATYQSRAERFHSTPEGVLRYRVSLANRKAGSYANLADGPFHTGIYLASQALRFAASGEAAALQEVRRTLRGLRLLMEVTGKRGLLARHISPAASLASMQDDRWILSETHPAYIWRSDVSKDQYAGFICGLGVTWFAVKDASIRRDVAELATAAADHLMDNDLRIVDFDGQRTTFGDLRPRFLCIPKGADVLIVMAIAKVAALSDGGERYEEFYRSLLEDDYPALSRHAHFEIFGITKRVNDHMAYLAFYPLLLLEEDPEVVRALREAEQRSWSYLKNDRNAFAAFIHAAFAVSEPEVEAARERGRSALLEFPESKVDWPVDLTRPGFDFPQAFCNDDRGFPRSRESVPLYLRARSSSMWAADPFRLVSRLGRRGDLETAGSDYLIAYWMGRRHGWVTPTD
jgi:hypothetical protein